MESIDPKIILYTIMVLPGVIAAFFSFKSFIKDDGFKWWTILASLAIGLVTAIMTTQLIPLFILDAIVFIPLIIICALIGGVVWLFKNKDGNNVEQESILNERKEAELKIQTQPESIKVVESEQPNLSDSDDFLTDLLDDEEVLEIFTKDELHELFPEKDQDLFTEEELESTREAVLDSVISIESPAEEESELPHIELVDLNPEVEGSYKELIEVEAGQNIIKTNVRSRKNRELALRVHGNTCIVCAFNFDAFYGARLSNGFIHIHHTKPIAKNTLQAPNIITDLVPVCANCHAMIHRRDEELSINQLKNAIKAANKSQ